MDGDCGSLLPLSTASLLASQGRTPQQAVATERQQAAAVHGEARSYLASFEHLRFEGVRRLEMGEADREGVGGVVRRGFGQA